MMRFLKETKIKMQKQVDKISPKISVTPSTCREVHCHRDDPLSLQFLILDFVFNQCFVLFVVHLQT